MKLLVILSASLALSVESAVLGDSTHPKSISGRIVGGQVTTVESHPYIVSLRRAFIGIHFCGGTVISNRTILTAAHCVANRQAIYVVVNAGVTFRNETGVERRVTRIINHPSYNESTKDYDIALVILNRPLRYSNKIRPANLPPAHTTLANGTLVHVSGWGDTKNSAESNHQLRTVELPIVDLETCNARYVDDELTERMICAGQSGGGKDSCKGDSGGPLVRDNTVYGVVSWGIGCGDSNYPGIYANVSAVLGWINENIQ